MTIQQIVINRLKLFTRRRAVSLLDGNYDSIFRGKGVELDSLRPYIAGDNTKDIDWRATARTGSVHTRLYTPLRDQRILVICDNSSSMLLPSYNQMNKLDAAFGLIVTLGMFVKKNRDLIAACYVGQNAKIKITNYSNTNNHIEKLLRGVDEALHKTPPAQRPDLNLLLQHALHSLRQRTAVFVVTDTPPQPDVYKPLLTKLGIKHQLFWLQLAPSWPFTQEPLYRTEIIDIEKGKTLPDYLAQDKQLQKEWLANYTLQLEAQRKMCKATGTAFSELEDPLKLPDELRKMFVLARRYAKRK